MIEWDSLVERRLKAENDPESHVERDYRTFHPSQISRCKRQCVLSKFGLKSHDVSTLGTFEMGNMIHRKMESFGPGLDGVVMEYPVEFRDGEILFTGKCDAHDRVENVVYDFKTRSSWYKFDPPDDAHLDQLHIYMAGLEADRGQIVYVSKKDLEIRTWPENRLFKFDGDRYRRIVDRAHDIAQTLEEHGTPETVEQVPFDRCGCWLCEREGDE